MCMCMCASPPSAETLSQRSIATARALASSLELGFLMEYVRACAAGVVSVAVAMAKDPPKTLRVLSAVSGFLLILGGIVGVFDPLHPLSMVISVYNIGFGLLIVMTELKSWPIIKTFQKSVDVYFHLLSVPRGKGGFYCFIGFLAFFSSDWNLSRVCVLIVSIVGLLHLFACQRCGAQSDEEAGAAGGAGLRSANEVSLGPLVESGSDDSSSTWASLMKQVVSDSPEVLSMGLSATSTAARSGAMATLGGGGGGGGGSGSSSATPAAAKEVDDDGLPRTSTMSG